MRNMVAALLMGGAALVGAGAAHAQQPTQSDGTDEGLFCIYEALGDDDDYTVVAEVFLYSDMPEESIAKAVSIVEKAQADCQGKHKFSQSQLESSSDFGLYSSALDYLEEDLVLAGVSDETLEKLLGIYDGLSEDDLDKLFELDWRSDAAFSGRIKASLLEAGVPNDDDAIDTGFAIMEVAAMADEAMFIFLLGMMELEADES